MEINYRRDIWKLLDNYCLPLVAAEIGVAEGLFSADMLGWGLNKLYCVDNWEHIPDTKGDGNNSQEWHVSNMTRAKERMQEWDKEGMVVFLKGMSTEMCQQVPDNSLGLLYLDGDHSYDGVRNDLTHWFAKVAPRGIIAGHDYLSPQYGVKEAVETFCRDRFEIHLIPEDKEEDAGFWFML
jgi:hypothetical protein